MINAWWLGFFLPLAMFGGMFLMACLTMSKDPEPESKFVPSQEEFISPSFCKCQLPFVFKPDGIHELDPCIYQEKEKFANVTVTISECTVCGCVDISWEKQDNTEELEING